MCVKIIFHILLLTKKILAGRKGRIKHNVEIIFHIITVRTERGGDGEEKHEREGEKGVGRRGGEELGNLLKCKHLVHNVGSSQNSFVKNIARKALCQF